MFMNKTKALEKEVEKLLQRLTEMALLLNSAIPAYFKKNFEDFEHFVAESDRLETEVDHIRKDIEMSLYSNMLIPESRGDVLGILEALDEVADCIEKVVLEFDIQKPEIPEPIAEDFLKIAELSTRCIEKLIFAVTDFFKSSDHVNILIQEVKYCESEIDRLEEGVKRKAFSGGSVSGLAVKLQIKGFAEQLCDISDFAEDVCERLMLSAIKRSI